jgi:hypothetical protein
LMINGSDYRLACSIYSLAVPVTATNNVTVNFSINCYAHIKVVVVRGLAANVTNGNEGTMGFSSVPTAGSLGPNGGFPCTYFQSLFGMCDPSTPTISWSSPYTSGAQDQSDPAPPPFNILASTEGYWIDTGGTGTSTPSLSNLVSYWTECQAGYR